MSASVTLFTHPIVCQHFLFISLSFVSIIFLYSVCCCSCVLTSFGHLADLNKSPQHSNRHFLLENLIPKEKINCNFNVEQHTIVLYHYQCNPEY